MYAKKTCRFSCIYHQNKKAKLHELHISLSLLVQRHCLQCFDAVGWAAGRASGLSGGVLAWLSVWSEVQTCIWPS